jgi:hypothetical protein
MGRCPNCTRGVTQFSARFRIDGGPVPAWLCDNPACSVRLSLARRDGTQPLSSKVLVQASTELRAQAVRSILRARARQEREKRLATKSGSG